MFRIKICGITNVDDVRAAIDAGADAIGLNFYESSPRHVTEERAREIVDSVRTKTVYVGVFVNKPVPEVNRIARVLGLSWVQLHGDEPPETLAAVSDEFNVIRVRRLEAGGVAAISDDLAACRAAGRGASAVLIDAAAPGQYGGTGHTVSWAGLADYRQWLGSTNLILAGGLTPENVGQAVRIVRPAAVDVTSGVESAKGRKDPVKMHEFISAAKGAFEELGERGA